MWFEVKKCQLNKQKGTMWEVVGFALRNEWKWNKILVNDSKWCPMMVHDGKWCQIMENDVKRWQMMSNDG